MWPLEPISHQCGPPAALLCLDGFVVYALRERVVGLQLQEAAEGIGQDEIYVGPHETKIQFWAFR